MAGRWPWMELNGSFSYHNGGSTVLGGIGFIFSYHNDGPMALDGIERIIFLP
jgi:hypothetical protein